jgi:hypothetical protein
LETTGHVRRQLSLDLRPRTIFRQLDAAGVDVSLAPHEHAFILIDLHTHVRDIGMPGAQPEDA